MGTTHNLDQEYWRPANQMNQDAQSSLRSQSEICSRCASEFVLGARFCHVCGAARDARPEQYERPGVSRLLDFHVIKDALGFTTGSLVAFIVGIACLLAAVATGLMYTANTVLDWQAVQVWRIQWLLAAAVAFVAGILLKRTS